MSTQNIQADYEALETIAASLRAESEQIDAETQQMNARLSTLQGGEWLGDAAERFYAEMGESVIPALKRLASALAEGSAITTHMRNRMQQAEDEATEILRRTLPGIGTTPSMGPNGAGGNSASPNGGIAGGAGQTDAGTPWLSIDRVKGQAKLWTESLGDKGKFNPSLEIKYKLFDGDLAYARSEGDMELAGVDVRGDAKAQAGKYDAGAKVGLGKDGFSLGAYGAVATGAAEANGVVGSKDLGATGSVGGKMLAAEAMIGVVDNQFGAKIGGTLISAEGSVGMNVAGVNVGVRGEVGLKAELGFEFGTKGVEVKLPFVSFGIGFGGAK